MHNQYWWVIWNLTWIILTDCPSKHFIIIVPVKWTFSDSLNIYLHSDIRDVRDAEQQETKEINIIVLLFSCCFAFHRLPRKSGSVTELETTSARSSRRMHLRSRIKVNVAKCSLWRITHHQPVLSLRKLILKRTEMSWNRWLPGRQEINLRTYATLGSNVKCRRLAAAANGLKHDKPSRRQAGGGARPSSTSRYTVLCCGTNSRSSLWCQEVCGGAAAALPGRRLKEARRSTSGCCGGSLMECVSPVRICCCLPAPQGLTVVVGETRRETAYALTSHTYTALQWFVLCWVSVCTLTRLLIRNVAAKTRTVEKLRRMGLSGRLKHSSAVNYTLKRLHDVSCLYLRCHNLVKITVPF